MQINIPLALLPSKGAAGVVSHVWVVHKLLVGDAWLEPIVLLDDVLWVDIVQHMYLPSQIQPHAALLHVNGGKERLKGG